MSLAMGMNNFRIMRFISMIPISMKFNFGKLINLKNTMSINKTSIFGNKLSGLTNLASFSLLPLSLAYSILFITTHKRKRIKIKIQKTWKRWRKIRNVNKANLKKK